MNKLRSVLKKRRAKEDPRVRRRLFSWRMFAMTLLVVSVLSAGNVFALEKLLKMQVFSVVASMGVGSYWVAMAFLAAIVLLVVAIIHMGAGASGREQVHLHRFSADFCRDFRVSRGKSLARCNQCMLRLPR